MNKAAFKHHRSSPAADDGGLWLQVRSVHDAGGGDGEGSQIESQENTHIQQEQQYLKSYTHTHTHKQILLRWIGCIRRTMRVCVTPVFICTTHCICTLTRSFSTHDLTCDNPPQRRHGSHGPKVQEGSSRLDANIKPTTWNTGTKLGIGAMLKCQVVVEVVAWQGHWTCLWNNTEHEISKTVHYWRFTEWVDVFWPAARWGWCPIRPAISRRWTPRLWRWWAGRPARQSARIK